MAAMPALAFQYQLWTIFAITALVAYLLAWLVVLPRLQERSSALVARSISPGMPRLQFRLSTLLWITLAVACWFGGMRVERWRTEQAERARL